MSITIASNCCYTLSLSDRRLSKLVAAQTREQATEMGLIDQIKDWLESGKKKHCLNLMYDLYRGQCALTPEVEDELTHLFENTDPIRLMLFWRGDTTTDESLFSHAMATGDVRTIKFCGSLLECFPLAKFEATMISVLFRGPWKNDITPLGLALINNKPEAVSAFIQVFSEISDRLRGVDNQTNELLDSCKHRTFSLDVFANISSVLTSSTTPEQLGGVKRLLAFIKEEAFPKLSKEYSFNVSAMMSSTEGTLLCSALNAHGNQTIVEGFEALLSILDTSLRQATVERVLLKPVDWFSQIYVFDSMTAEEMHQRFDTFDRYASLLQRLSLVLPKSTWQYNDSTAVKFKYMDCFIRSALKLKRYDTVSSLLKLTTAEYDPLFSNMLSKMTRGLLGCNDWASLEALLMVNNARARGAVLATLHEDEDKRNAFWRYIVSNNNVEIIDDLFFVAALNPNYAYLISELVGIISPESSPDVGALMAVIWRRLLPSKSLSGELVELWGCLSQVQKKMLADLIVRDDAIINKLCKIAPGSGRFGAIFFEIIKAAPEDSLEPLFKIILRHSPPIISGQPPAQPLPLFAVLFYFNHLDPPGESLLTVISQLAIEDGLKKCLMGRIAQSMNGLNAQQKYRLAESALDIWLSDDGYLENKDILTFVRAVRPVTVEAANQGRLVANNRYLALLVEYVKDCFQKENTSYPYRTGEFMLNNNGFFVQLMALCTGHQDSSIRDAAVELYDQYLKLDELRPHAAYLSAGYDLADGIRSAAPADEVLTQDPATRAAKFGLQASDPVYIFVAGKIFGEGRYIAVLLSKKNIADIFGNDDAPWPTNTFTDDTVGPDTQAVLLSGGTVAEPYLQFPVFAQRYIQARETRIFKKLFKIIDLNYVADEPGEVSFDYTEQFLAALSVNKPTGQKLTGKQDQDRLDKIFRKYLSMSDDGPPTPETLPTLKTAHLAQIYALFELEAVPENVQDKVRAAQTLFCLATLFCRFSSQSVFGMAADSPRVLRYYAGALLKQAHELAPTVIGEEHYLGFRNWLYGFDVAQTCTDMLSMAMADYIRSHSAEFRLLFEKLKPITWKL